MFKLFSSGTKSYKSMSGQEFKEQYSSSKQPVLIDVRTAGEYATGTIKEAKNIDITSPNFLKQVGGLDKDKEYFLFCRSGTRSGHACSIMAKEGFKVYNLEGGIGSWT
jgi:rhodanese-related sulfurtransferase